ncbi:MAG: peptidoglycan DD-metalloendopeptidase family protein [Nitrospirales bacterium]|nr:peptidoglycan DD-metalloendopeptidase family protein [Nitrospira sp.]MDR4501671.1 peptidoglycan DD-metalloendopeptidase family protein [Nitrospirales bacterium]
MRQTPRFWSIILLSTSMACPLPIWAASQPKTAISQELEQERLRLKKLNEEINKTKQKAKKAEKQSESVLKKIEKLDKALVKKQQEYRRIDKDLKGKDRELSQVQKQLSNIESEVSQHRKGISNRLRLLYMEGRGGYLKALFEADTFANFERRLAYLSTISKQEYQLLTDYRRQLEELENLKTQRAKAREELLSFKQQTQQTINDMKGVKKDKHVVLTSLSKEQKLYERTVEGLQRSAKQVDALLKELDQRFKLSQAQAKTKKSKAHNEGSLLWPTQGTVVSFFGRQKHPTFDTYVNKKGIEIRTNHATAIKTVSQGTVVYADWLKGYGLVVIVDHTNGFFSLYAHASTLLVKEGQKVSQGQVIGKTGETGLTDNNTLYFELRKGTKPVDPLRWLVKRP